MPSYSGLFNGVYGINHSLLTTAKGNDATAIARQLSRKTYGRASLRALFLALTGAAAGGTATTSHKRVDAFDGLDGIQGGGKRDIETFTPINRATTAADETRVDAMLSQTSTPTYPVDKSGNGGGNKVGI